VSRSGEAAARRAIDLVVILSRREPPPGEEVRMIVLVLLLLANMLMAQTASGELKPCEPILTTFYPGWDSKVPAHKQARVEIRNCGTADKVELQIVAWTAYAAEPSAVLKTGAGRIVWNRDPRFQGGLRLPTVQRDNADNRIVRVVMAGNIFIVETAGEGRSLVTVLLFERGGVWVPSQKDSDRHLPVELYDNTVTLTSWSQNGTQWKSTYSTGLK
jgi:hypothetical protein